MLTNNNVPEAKNPGKQQSQTQVYLTGKGGPSVLQLVESSLPTPQTGEVRVKVLAAGVAYSEVMQRYGLYPGQPKPPYTPGYDVAGVIDAVGTGVNGWSVGQRVAALTVFGGYAKYICLNAEKLVSLPAEVDPVEATSLVLNYVTAYQMLHRIAKVQSGQAILVHGAAGGVGTALVQLGKLAGVKIYGTASTTKQKLVSDLGATPIDYKTQNFVRRVVELNGGGVDAVFDAVGGSHLDQSFKALRKGGILIGYGVQSVALGHTSLAKAMVTTMLPTVGRLKLWSVLPTGRRAIFFGIDAKAHLDWFKQDLAALVKLLVEGQIKPVIAARLPLSQVGHAHELMEKGQVEGKIVLLPQEA